MKHLLTRLVHTLEAGQTVAEALICEHSGSTPRSAGANMLVFADGSQAGSVGGGLLEAQVQARAMEMLSASPGAPDNAALLSFDFNDGQAAAEGMICGGRLQVFVQRIDPDKDTLQMYVQAAQALGEGHGATLLYALENAPDRETRITDRWLLDADTAPRTGTAEELEPELVPELGKEARKAARSGGAALFTWQGRSYLVAPHIENGNLILVGAGHVAQHTAALAARVGFSVTVLDDRAEFANAQRYPDAHKTIVLDSFDDCFADAPVDANSYVVIVTRGHLHDKTVLGQALRSPAAYLGMIGSTRKRDAIYAALEKEGFAAGEFERVHSPIGLAIGAETPEEIAVSIVAELVRARALRRGTSRHV